MIWRQIFGRTSILGGWLFGVVWTEWSLFFQSTQVSVLQFILFFKSSLGIMGCEAFNSVPQPWQRRPLLFLLSYSYSMHDSCHKRGDDMQCRVNARTRWRLNVMLGWICSSRWGEVSTSWFIMKPADEWYEEPGSKW